MSENTEQYKPKAKSFSESIVYNAEKDVFEIERSYGIYPHETKEIVPLIVWGLEKSQKAKAIVRREIQSEDLDNPVETLFYVIDLTFTVEPKMKTLYLRKEPLTSENPNEKFCRIYVKDVDNGSCLECPVNNVLDSEAVNQLGIEIIRGKATKISKSEALVLVKSGLCLGVFTDKDLTRRLV